MKCTFCGSIITKGTGKMFVKTDGRVLLFCSRRCEKNIVNLGRNPRRVQWTELAHHDKSVRMHAQVQSKTESVKQEKSKLPKAQQAITQSKKSKIVKSDKEKKQ